MSGKSSRTKGHNFEREVARRMREYYPEAKRGFQTRGGTQEECDVEGTPFAIECKVGKRPNIRGAYNQAKCAQYEVTEQGTTRKDHRPIVVVTKKDREDTLVTIQWDMFEAFLSALKAYGRVEKAVEGL